MTTNRQEIEKKVQGITCFDYFSLSKKERIFIEQKFTDALLTLQERYAQERVREVERKARRNTIKLIKRRIKSLYEPSVMTNMVLDMVMIEIDKELNDHTFLNNHKEGE